MNTSRSRFGHRRQNASALVAVLMVLALISAFSIATAQRMYALKRDLKLIVQKQLLKFQSAPGTTNQVGVTRKPNG